MKKVLIIGSTTVDVVIDLDKLPTTKGSVNAKGQTSNLGGCAYNVSDTVRNFEVPSILFSPIGGGMFGEFARAELERKGIQSRAPAGDGDHGCCYCYVEDNGERSFIAYHGVEYYIYEKWLDRLNIDEIHSIYICGIEIEEKTGGEIVSFLEKHPDIPLFYAPGPRHMYIDQKLVERIMALHPIVHLNDNEVVETTGETDIEKAARMIYDRSGNTVIVTLGPDGSAYYDGEKFEIVPPVKAEKITDTIGAGDSHIGAVMSCLYMGMSVRDSLAAANRVASAVIGEKGSHLPKEKFDRIIKLKDLKK